MSVMDLKNKLILDACCGARMFWTNKQNPLAVFMDIRDEEHELCDGRKILIHPDVLADYTNMPFPDRSFKLVVFDPPHLRWGGKKSWIVKRYGELPKDWQSNLRKGVDECFRVLDDYGMLVFKWSEAQISTNRVLEAIGRQPLFGHTTGRCGKTLWMCFLKLPDGKEAR